MNLTDEIIIRAPRNIVYGGLNDADILKACIPQCEKLEWINDTQLEAVIAIKISLAKIRLKGILTLDAHNPPMAFTLTGEGKSKIMGFAKGVSEISLQEIEDRSATRLSYQANLLVEGKVAKLGADLISSTILKVARRFFETFEAELLKTIV